MRDLSDEVEAISRRVGEQARRKHNPAGYALERISTLMQAFQKRLKDDVEVTQVPC